MKSAQLKKNREICDIAIIGGGMVGSVIALLLNKALPSLKIVLFDQCSIDASQSAPTQPSFDERATAVSPSSVSVLKQLDLWQGLAPYATAIESIHVSDQGLPGLSVFDRQDNQGEALGYVIENKAFGVALAKALTTSTIECIAPYTVDQLYFEQDYAVMRFGENERRCRLAVVSDGADSRLRKRLGIVDDRHAYEQHAMVANIVSQKPHGGRAFERFTASGPLALLPLGRELSSRLSTLVWTLPNKTFAQSQAWDDEQFITHFQAQFGFRLGYFQQVSARKAYPLERVLAREQVRSRLVLMGNAAHFLHPVAGQGFNLSLRDALRLVEQLKIAHESGSDIGSLHILSAYAEQARVDQYSTVGLSQSFVTFFQRTDPASIIARTLGFMALETKPSVRQLFIRQLSGRAQREARVL